MYQEYVPFLYINQLNKKKKNAAQAKKSETPALTEEKYHNPGEGENTLNGGTIAYHSTI